MPAETREVWGVKEESNWDTSWRGSQCLADAAHQNSKFKRGFRGCKYQTHLGTRGVRSGSRETCVETSRHGIDPRSLRTGGSLEMPSIIIDQQSLIVVLVGCAVGVISVAARSARNSRFRDGKEVRPGSSNDVKPTAIVTWNFGEIAVLAAATLLEDGSSAVDATEAGKVRKAKRELDVGLIFVCAD